MTAEDVNAAQLEYWNSVEAGHWIEQLASYDAMLRPYADQLIAAATIERDDRVLDVGCGTGTTTLTAAAVATDGEAFGVDISRPMIERARGRARDAGVENARFEIADAQIAALGSASHDAVISRFGVMFFSDPVAAFANIARATRADGRLVFVCWQSLAQNEWMLVPGMAAATQVPLPALGEPGAPGPFAFGEADHVGRVLTAAGFRDVDLEPLQDAIVLGGGGTLDDAVEFLRGTGMARAIFADAEPGAVGRALDAVRAALAAYETPEGVCLGAAAWLVRARR